MRPQVIIMDFPTAMQTGLQTLLHVKRRWPGASVLVLAPNGDGATIEAARRGGADGYLLRNDRRTELIKAITALAGRKHYISTSVMHTRARGNGRAPAHAVRRSDTAAMLPGREQEVIALVAEGYRTREVAELLKVSQNRSSAIAPTSCASSACALQLAWSRTRSRTATSVSDAGVGPGEHMLLQLRTQRATQLRASGSFLPAGRSCDGRSGIGLPRSDDRDKGVYLAAAGTAHEHAG